MSRIRIIACCVLAANIFSGTASIAEELSREEKLRERELSLPARTIQLDEWQNELERQTAELESIKQSLAERAMQIPEKEMQISEQQAELDNRKKALDSFAKTLEEHAQEIPLREIELREQKGDLDRREAEIAQIESGLSQQKSYIEQAVAELNSKAAELETARKIISENDAKVTANAQAIIARQKEFNAQVRAFTEEKKAFEAKISELRELEQKLKSQSDETATTLKNEIAAKKSELAKMSQDLKEQRDMLAQYREKILEAEHKIKILETQVSSLNNEVAAYKDTANTERKRADALEESLKKQSAELEKLRSQFDDKMDVKMITEFLAQINSDVPVRINHAVTSSDGAFMNWSGNYMEGTGMAAIPTQYKDTAQGVALARRGAILDLQRNLLEAMKGVNINSETKMEDFMATDSVRSAVEGTIKGVEVYEGKQNGDMYIVKGRIRLDRIHDEAANQLSRTQREGDPVEYSNRRGKKSRARARVVRSGDFTGLIIDARHLPIQPSMFTRILDEEGRPVYGVNFGNRDIQNQSGLYVWYSRMLYARDEQRVGSRPMIIKAQRLSNSDHDIVIPNYAAHEIRNNSYNFRRECRVIIVKN